MPHQCTACGHAFADGSKEMLGGCPDCGGNKFQFYPDGTDVPDEPPTAAEPDASEAPEPSVSSTVGRATTKVRDFVSSGPPAGQSDGGGDGPDPDATWPTEADPSASGGEPDIIDADARETERALTDAEDHAQASARSELASEAEVEASSPDGTAAPPDGEEPPADAAAASPAGTASSTDSSSVAPSPVPESTGTDPADTGESAPTPDTGEVPPVDDPSGRVIDEPTAEGTEMSELREQLNDQFESIKILEPGQYELNLMELYDREEYIIALQENGRYMIQVPEQWHGDGIGE